MTTPCRSVRASPPGGTVPRASWCSADRSSCAPTTRIERTALVNEVLVEYIAELLGRDPSEIDP